MTTLDPERDETTTSADRRPFPPSENRFLFVDVAAQRAKQLRRGALPRLDRPEQAAVRKLERIAMDEVAEGIIPYELSGPKADAAEVG